MTFRYYPIWLLNQKEEWLNLQEQAGYRLESVKWGIFYRFKKAQPCDSVYFSTIIHTRGKSMDHWGYNLKREHHANEIPTSFSSVGIFRIKSVNSDELLLLYQSRASFIQHEILEELILSGVLLLAFIGLVAVYGMNPLWWTIPIFSIYFLYNLIGLIVQHQEIKRLS